MTLRSGCEAQWETQMGSQNEIMTHEPQTWLKEWPHTAEELRLMEVKMAESQTVSQGTLVGSPSLGGNSSDGQSEQSSWHSNQMRVSWKEGQSGQTGRGFRVKFNLPTFKDEKAKDAVTYHSWQGDVSMFHWSGWDDHHLLPYVFRSLQGWGYHPGPHPPDVGWALWCHDDLWCLKQGALFPQAGKGRECGCIWSMPMPTCANTPTWSILVESNRSTWRR